MTDRLRTTPDKVSTDELHAALVELRRQGTRPVCADPAIRDLWYSPHHVHQQKAERLCVGCPVTVACRRVAEANHEQWGVWGGVAYQRSASRKATR